MNQRSERGFTLLEVLVATVIMAMAVAGVMSALSTSLRNSSRLTDHDRAAMLARRKMDEILLERRLPRHRTIEGLYDPAQTGGHASGWKFRVTPFELPPTPSAGQDILDRIEVQVWWVTATEPQTFTLEGFRRTLLTPEDVAEGALLPR